MKTGVAARLRAAEVVERVLEQGAHSNVLLDQRTDLDDRERASAHRLALDTLRWLPRTDGVLADLSSRDLDDLDPAVRAVLRVGVTELMEGGDPHGVVDSAVEAVRESGEGRASGYVNAVLRTLVRLLEEPDGAPSTGPAAELGCPDWIYERLTAAWGGDETAAFLAATLEAAPIGVRIRPGASASPGTPVEGIPGAALVTDRDEVVAAGDDIVVMDAASVAVADAVRAAPGHTVLDMAAAPGNKTAALWDAMRRSGVLIATDSHIRRTTRAARRMARIEVGAHWVCADGRMPPFGAATFDRILIDAPCTGLGTLRRRPEIKLRLDPGSPVRMGSIQRSMVEAALPLVRPGGRLVYSVCTVFPEETIDVAAEFGGRPPSGMPGRVWGDGVLMAPHLTPTDGMYVSVIDV